MGKKIKSDFKRCKSRITFLTPFETAIKGVKIELFSNKEAAVDGCKGVIDYSDSVIKLKIPNGEVAFYGNCLQLSQLGDGLAAINGEIKSVEFL